MLISTLVIGRFGYHISRDHLSNFGEIAISVVLAGLALVGWIGTSAHTIELLDGLSYLPMVMPLALALGACIALIAVPSQTSLQERSPVELRGRVFALLYTLTSLVVIGPLIFIGALADRIGIPAVTLLVAVTTLASGVFGIIRDRQMKLLTPAEATESS
jgi:hypothetical protein